jgi:protein gp37
MAETTPIAWTDHTFNPWWGCTKASPGCVNCYAERFAVQKGLRCFGPNAERKFWTEDNWSKPLQWDRKASQEGCRRRVFCGSMMDLFEDNPSLVAAKKRVWQIIRQTPALDWLLLTKRAERIASNLPADWGSGYPNVWLGVTIENANYIWRADYLRVIPAAVRFISYEPALGPLEIDLTGIDWLIYGGESGPKRRKDDSAWAHSIKAQCEAAGTAFFFKQYGGLKPGNIVGANGDLVRQFPRL